MFKKIKIAAVMATVLGLSSMAAQAISVNDAGSHGEVLVFPYYNVNSGFVTVFKVTNTTSAYKAVKIRFRESENSNDVLDFNLYLSPFDVFRMDLVEGADGGVLLKAEDKSCTHPTIPDAGVAFRYQAYHSTSIADVREGYLEVIEMGELDQTATVVINGQSKLIAGQGILHGSDGLPFDCSVIDAAWRQGVFTQGGAASNTGAINTVHSEIHGYPQFPSTPGYYGFATVSGLTAPAGGLVGTSIFIDPVNIAGYVVEPLSVVNYSNKAQHYISADHNFYLLPSLASGNVQTSEYLGIQNAYGTVARDWGMDDQNLLPRPSVPSGINAMPIANAMLVTQIANQYFLGEGTVTDWVLSAPMRKHAIYNNHMYVASSAGYVQGTPASTDAAGNFVLGVGDIPVNGVIGDDAAPNGYWKFLNVADVNARFDYWDNEEGQATVDLGDFSPPLVTNPTEIPFDREVNILALHHASDPEADSVLGSVNARGLTLEPGYLEGWGAFTFNNYDLHGARYAAWVNLSAVQASGVGVPLFGFMVVRSALGDSDVGEAFPHFTTRNR